MQPIHILSLVSWPFFSFGVNIRKCWSSLFSAFVFNRAEERGTPMNTRVMCVILKFQPKEKLDHVGASTSRGSGQLSIMSVSAPGHLGKYYTIYHTIALAACRSLIQYTYSSDHGWKFLNSVLSLGCFYWSVSHKSFLKKCDKERYDLIIC